jgi:hypothetical protein
VVVDGENFKRRIRGYERLTFARKQAKTGSARG